MDRQRERNVQFTVQPRDGLLADPADLLGSAQTFLTRILANSEDLDPDPDAMQPDRVRRSAMAEAMVELADDDYDW
jgi:hypothetical protein